MKFSLHILLSLFIIGMIACDDDEPAVPLSTVEDYFPLELGKVLTFKVDSIIYDNLGNDVTRTSVLLQERYVDTVRDNSDDLVHLIERWYADTSTQDYTFHSLVSSGYSDNYAIYTENNLRFAKLQSPIYLDRTWDGNQFVDPLTTIIVKGESLEIFKFWEEDYRIIEEGGSIELNETVISDVITVLQADADSRIERRYSIEKYARGIGLVYRELWVLDTQCTMWNSLSECIPVPWEEKAEKGFILKQWRIL